VNVVSLSSSRERNFDGRWRRYGKASADSLSWDYDVVTALLTVQPGLRSRRSAEREPDVASIASRNVLIRQSDTSGFGGTQVHSKPVLEIIQCSE